MDLKETGCNDIDWTQLILVIGSCEYSNKLLGSRKGSIFPEQLDN